MTSKAGSSKTSLKRSTVGRPLPKCLTEVHTKLKPNLKASGLLMANMGGILKN